MPINDGETPGADDSAENESGGNANDGNAAGNAGDKGKSGDEGDKPKPGQVVFGSQQEVDDMIKKRVDRALKKATDDAKLTETQRLEKERDDALKLVRDRDLKDEFVSKSGLDMSKGSRLFAMYKDDLEVNDAGKATNIEAVLKTAKAEFPELFGKTKPGKADGGDGNNEAAAGGDMNSLLRRATGRS